MKLRSMSPASRGLLISVLSAAMLFGTAQMALAKGPSGGGGGSTGGGGHHSSDPPCSVSPSSMAVGDSYTVSVSGIGANLALNVDVQYPATLQIFGVGSDGSGTLSLTLTALQTGSPSVSIYDVSGSKTALVSTCSFTVT
jgi:hypothetical protein